MNRKIFIMLMCLMLLAALTSAIAQADEEKVTITAAAGAGGSLARRSIEVIKGTRVDLNTLFEPASNSQEGYALWTGEDGSAIEDGIITVGGDITVKAVFMINIIDEAKPMGGNVIFEGTRRQVGDQTLIWTTLTVLAAASVALLSAVRIRGDRSMYY